MSRGMYGEVFWWEVSTDRNHHHHKVSISNVAGWWTLYSDDRNIFKFDNKAIAEECWKMLMEGCSIRACLNNLYKYDIWVDSREGKCYLRDINGQINR